MASTSLRVGLIGAGRIGQIHASNLAFHLPGAELVAVFDPDPAAARRCAAALDSKRTESSAEAVIEATDVDAVLICSPTGFHAQQIEACAAHGKHVFCEKPIDLDLERIDSALAAVREAGVKLQVGFNRRFDPSFRRARDLVASGGIGAPQLVRITSRDPGPPPLEYIESSGGLFLDMTIHDFDVARWIVAEEISELFAMSSVLVDPAIGEHGDVDTAVISLRYASGALGCIDNSRKAVYGYDQRLEVFGSDGCVLVGNVPPTTAELCDGRGVTRDKPLHFFLERYEAAYREELREFVQCIAEDRSPSVGGADGRLAVHLALCAQQSLQQNRPIRPAAVI